MNEYILHNQKVYDSLALEYAKRMSTKSQDEEEISTMASYILDFYLGKGNRFLELGPGTGQILKYMSKNGFDTTGIELSNNMAHLALSNSEDSNIINNNALECDFHDQSFDLIYASAIIHLFTYADASFLIKQIRNWLSEDGLLFINTTTHRVNYEGFISKYDYQDGSCFRFRRLWKEQTFIDFILNNGFEIIHRFKTNEISRDKKWIGLTCRKVE